MKVHFFSVLLLTIALLFMTSACNNRSNHKLQNSTSHLVKEGECQKVIHTLYGNVGIFESEVSEVQNFDARYVIDEDLDIYYEKSFNEWPVRKKIEINLYPKLSGEKPSALIQYDFSLMYKLLVLGQNYTPDGLISVNLNQIKYQDNSKIFIVLLDVLYKKGGERYVKRFPLTIDLEGNALFANGLTCYGISSDYLVMVDSAPLLEGNGKLPIYRWYDFDGNMYGWTFNPNGGLLYTCNVGVTQSESYFNWIDIKHPQPSKYVQGDNVYEKHYGSSGEFKESIDYFVNGRRSKTFMFIDEAPDLRFWDKVSADFVEVFYYSSRGYVSSSRIYTRESNDYYISLSYKDNGNVDEIYGIRKEGTGFFDDDCYSVEQNYSIFSGNSYTISKTNHYGQKEVVSKLQSKADVYTVLLQYLQDISGRGQGWTRIETMFDVVCDDMDNHTIDQVANQDELSLITGIINRKYKYHMFLDGNFNGYMYYDSQGPNKTIAIRCISSEQVDTWTINAVLQEVGEDGTIYGTYDCWIERLYDISGTYTNSQGKEMPFEATFS